MALKKGKIVAGPNQYAGATGSPAGMVAAFALAAAPTGWIAADGSAVSRTTYAALFTAMGTIHGTGDGSTTFNLPDYRGTFLRGIDGTKGNDPDKLTRTAMNTGGNTGNQVGSVQGDVFGSHNHINNWGDGTSGAYPGHSYIPSIAIGWSPTGNPGSYGSTMIQPSGGNETRPKNAYVLYCVKT